MTKYEEKLLEKQVIKEQQISNTEAPEGTLKDALKKIKKGKKG
jgi:hypothetical protein